MSPTKQKSKERQAARDRKSSVRQVASGGTSANGYNPTSGTFHTLEPVTTDTGTGFLNGRFKSIDDVEENASANGGAGDLECMSNNGSYSGESEDQLSINGKEKQGAGKVGSRNGVLGGTDKRDKVRGKNERKHQRQKERRAQELRDKCNGYLMSRKLEVLSQQLVAMGFSQERATMALILNDGHVERSVAWLLEGGEGEVHEDWNTGTNPKIDISEELGYILEIEKKYNVSRPDIERAVVSCEGDLAKAVDWLKSRRSRSVSPGREEGKNNQAGVDDPPVVRKEELPASVPAAPPGLGATQSRINGFLQPSYQVRRDERVSLPSTKGRMPSGSTSPHAPPDILTKGSAHSRKSSIDSPVSSLPPQRWVHAQGGRAPPGSAKALPPQDVPVSKAETGHVFSAGRTDPKLSSVISRDAILKASSKDTLNTGQMHLLTRASSQPNVSNIPSSPAYSSSGRSYCFMDAGSPSSVVYVNAGHGNAGLNDINAHNKTTESLMGAFQPQTQTSLGDWLGNAQSNDVHVASFSNISAHSRSSSSTSYGLFTGWGTGLSHSSVDWSTGPLQNCDYRTIDWSMNAASTFSQGLSGKLDSLTLQGKSSYTWGHEQERERGFPTGFGAGSIGTDSRQGQGVWKVVEASGPRIQENFSNEPANTTTQEWTSPFAGKDLFNIPQAVPSPSL